MNARLKEVRTSLNMTQQKFAEKLEVSKNNIVNYELGRRAPSDLFIRLVCKEFGINETWLRTGEGEMKAPPTKQQEIAEITTKLQKADPEGIQYKLIKFLSKLDTDQWQAISDLIDELATKKEP